MYEQRPIGTMVRSAFLPAAAAAAIATASVARGGDISITPLVLSGDTFTGGGTVSSIRNVAINNHGDWTIEFTNTVGDGVVLRNGEVYLMKGDPLAAPPGATIRAFDTLNLNDDGNSFWNFFLDGYPSNQDSGLFFNTNLIVQEGNESNAFGFSQGTTYLGFFEAKLALSNFGIALVTVDDPKIPGSVNHALMRYDFNAKGELMFESIIRKQGDSIVGVQEPIDSFQTNPHTFSLSSAGMIVTVRLDAAAAVDSLIWHSELGVRSREGDPSPAGPAWMDFGVGTRADTNDSNNVVILGRIATGNPADDRLIARDDVKLIQTGDPPPGIGGGFAITTFGTAPVLINNDSEVLYFARWNDPNTAANDGLFLNDQLLARKGVTQISGLTLTEITSVTNAFAMSRNGRFVIFRGRLSDNRTGAFLIDRDPAPGAPATLTDFEFTLGVHTSGGLSSLEAIDGDELIGRSQFGFSATEANVIEVEVQAVNTEVPSPTAIDVSTTMRLNNPGGTATLRMHNWGTGQNDFIGEWPVEQTGSTMEFTNLDAALYLGGLAGDQIAGRVRAAVVATFAADGFDAFWDQVRYMVR